MDSRSQTDEFLILRGRDYQETDRLLVAFGRRVGKISALAKGARRSGSHLKAAVLPFCYSRLQLRPPRRGANGGLWIVTQGETIEALPQLREDLNRIACASYIGELLDIALPEEKPQESLFVLGSAALTLLAGTESGEEAYLPLRYFELRLLGELGWRPRFDICARCGRKVGAGQAGQNTRYLPGPALGGVICADCIMARGGGQLPSAEDSLSPGAVRIMERLLNWDLRRLFNLRIGESLRREVETGIQAFLNYHLGNAAAKAKEQLLLYISDCRR